MNIMKYKGYSARIEYSDEDDCFVGHIAGIKDIIGFHADSVKALHKAFEEAINDYLETCKKLNRPPEKPYSGKILLRIAPELHARVAIQAELHGKSLNSWVSELLSKAG